MTNRSRIALFAAFACALGACSSMGNEYGLSDYAYVPAKRVAVGNGGMSVRAPRPWNRKRAAFFTDISGTEDWTLNGPLLDGISFVTGLKGNRALIRQDRHDAQQVPKFREDMTPPEIAAMLESLFRVRGGAIEFHTLGLKPRQFLHTSGFQIDYEHLDTDEIWRQGRAVGAVIDGRLYLIMMDAAKSHYYAEVLPDLEAMVKSAAMGRS